MDGDKQTPPTDRQNLYQPDQVITPDSNPTPVQPVSTDAPGAQSQATPTTPSQPFPTDAVAYESSANSDPEAITWTASEFIAHQKSSNWYILLGLAAVVVAVVVWVLTRDLFPTVAVLIGVMLLGVYAGRQPRQETYALDSRGLTIGSRHYGYHEFRSFSVVPEGSFLSIELAPLKRFAVDITLYVDPADEDRILDRLSAYLPMEEARTNLADGLMRRIRF